ncbi:hypothetical protein BDZ89DRAFT_1142267 [Hymenopellis radicata]|nr:hypothetical protein BDZ89DRAFT_1142267 [Hymenopellis radicata]
MSTSIGNDNGGEHRRQRVSPTNVGGIRHSHFLLSLLKINYLRLQFVLPRAQCRHVHQPASVFAGAVDITTPKFNSAYVAIKCLCVPKPASLEAKLQLREFTNHLAVYHQLQTIARCWPATIWMKAILLSRRRTILPRARRALKPSKKRRQIKEAMMTRATMPQRRGIKTEVRPTQSLAACPPQRTCKPSYLRPLCQVIQPPPLNDAFYSDAPFRSPLDAARIYDASRSHKKVAYARYAAHARITSGNKYICRQVCAETARVPLSFVFSSIIPFDNDSTDFVPLFSASYTVIPPFFRLWYARSTLVLQAPTRNN